MEEKSTPHTLELLGVDGNEVLSWFARASTGPYALIEISDADAQAWRDKLGVALRRCYVSDAALESRAAATGRSLAELVAARLPDRGATMAGDFGEFVVFLYHAARAHPESPIGVLKWQLKQDRTKPAPYSDVVHLILPTWPAVSSADRIICSEVKTKSTAGKSRPIAEAIVDCEKDRLSRLARTLVWLRERALAGDLAAPTLDQLSRFIDATDHPEAGREYLATAVVAASLIPGELGDAPREEPTDYAVVIIAVPGLKDLYESVYAAAASAPGLGDPS